MTTGMFETRTALLLDDSSLVVLDKWGQSLDKNSPPDFSEKALVDAFKNRVALSRLLEASRDDLKKINSAIFNYLMPYQKERLKTKLIRAHYLYSLQCEIDKVEMRWDGLAKNLAQCKNYESLYSRLNKPAVDEKITPAAQLEEQSEQSEKPLAWFGMVVLAPLFSKHLFDLCSGKIASIKSFMADIEQKNLYMGWSRTLLLSVIVLLPQSVTAEHDPGALLNQAGPGLSYIGFFTIQFRLAIELLILAKNSFSGAWMSRHKTEKIPVWEQFTIQLDQRKYVLLNGIIFSGINVVTFLWLTGLLEAAPFGPLLSVGHRICQLCVLACRYDQELTQHRAVIEQITEERRLLLEKRDGLIIQLQAESSDIEQKRLQIQIQMRINMLQEEIDSHSDLSNQSELKWRCKNSEFKQQMMFTIGLLSGVALLSCLIFPPAAILPAIPLVFGLIGAAICFTSIILFSAARGCLDVEKSNQEQEASNKQKNSYLGAFIELKKQKNRDDGTEMKMKQLYLQIKELEPQPEHQMRVLQHQQTMLFVQVLREALLPVVVLAMLISLPTGIGFGVILGVMLLSLFVNKVLDRYEPIAPEQCVFAEDAYQAFLTRTALEQEQPDQSIITEISTPRPEG